MQDRLSLTSFEEAVLCTSLKVARLFLWTFVVILLRRASNFIQLISSCTSSSSSTALWLSIRSSAKLHSVIFFQAICLALDAITYYVIFVVFMLYRAKVSNIRLITWNCSHHFEQSWRAWSTRHMEEPDNPCDRSSGYFIVDNCKK